MSKQLSSWIGFVLSHLSKYEKVTHRSNVAQRKAVLRKRELAAAAAADRPVTAASAAAAATATASSPVPPPFSSPSNFVSSASQEGARRRGKTLAGPPAPAAAAVGAIGEKREGDTVAEEKMKTPGVTAGGGGDVAAQVEERAVARGARQLGAVSGSGATDAAKSRTSVAVRRLGVISRGDGGEESAPSKGGRRLGVISREGTEAGAGDKDKGRPAEGARRLGVLSRGGVEVARLKAAGGEGIEEEEDEKEEEGDWEAKESARRVRRGKLILHARRGVMEAEELLATGRLVFPLRPVYVKELRRLKVCEAGVSKQIRPLIALPIISKVLNCARNRGNVHKRQVVLLPASNRACLLFSAGAACGRSDCNHARCTYPSLSKRLSLPKHDRSAFSIYPFRPSAGAHLRWCTAMDRSMRSRGELRWKYVFIVDDRRIC